MTAAMENLQLIPIFVQSLTNVNWEAEIVIMISIVQEISFVGLTIVDETFQQTELNGIGMMTVARVRQVAFIFWSPICRIIRMNFRINKKHCSSSSSMYIRYISFASYNLSYTADPPQNIQISHHNQLPNIYSTFMGNYYKLLYSANDKPIYKMTISPWPHWRDWHFFDTSEGNPGNRKANILKFDSLDSSIVPDQFRDQTRMWRVSM